MTIQLRRDTAANWTSNNPVLASGQVGVETDAPLRIKVGNGATAWNSLPYMLGGVQLIFHGAAGGTARPAGAVSVIWVGTATPTNANTSLDLWVDTT